MTPRIRFLLLLGGVLIVATLALFAWLRRDEFVDRGTDAGDSTAVALRSVTLWFASADGERLVPEMRELPEVGDLQGRVAAVVAALDRGPEGDAVRTVPAGTRVLHVFLDDEGVLTLDLSRAFRQGFHGGARAEEAAIGALVRTVAAEVPEARRVRIVCGGRALPTLGGHVPLDRPLDPRDWP